MARLKCAADGCQEFAQAGTRYCCRPCQKAAADGLPTDTIDTMPATSAARTGASWAMLESTPPSRVHRNERRANGCNAKSTSRRS